MSILEHVATAKPVTISTVVLPVDFSSLSWRVLPLALHVARRFGAEVQPVHVDTASPWRDADAAALRLRATPFGRPVTVTVTSSADPVAGIVEFAGPRPEALIAMSSHGHSGVGEVAFGSVSEGVLRTTDNAVLMVGPRFEVDRYAFVRRTVACVDMTASGDVIVPEALAWAQAFDVPFELVTVLPRHSSNSIDQELAARFEGFVNELAATDPRVTGLILEGNRPAAEIVRHVQALRGTLLAMATHARPAMARAVVGSTTSAVLRHSPSGLLLCRRS